MLLILVILIMTYGEATASAQQAGNIYAAATLSPPGSSEENSTSGATFESAPGGTRITVTAMGLQPNDRYTAQIRADGCDGQVLYELQTLEMDASAS